MASELQHVLRGPARAAGLRAGGSFNLGRPADRVPDLGWHRGPPTELYFATAALVIEVLSPGDESEAKRDFYAHHGVDELWFVDPLARSVRILALGNGTYVERSDSPLLRLTARDVERQVDWP